MRKIVSLTLLLVLAACETPVLVRETDVLTETPVTYQDTVDIMINDYMCFS